MSSANERVNALDGHFGEVSRPRKPEGESIYRQRVKCIKRRKTSDEVIYNEGGVFEHGRMVSDRYLWENVQGIEAFVTMLLRVKE
jgi:hypothetical protein